MQEEENKCKFQFREPPEGIDTKGYKVLQLGLYNYFLEVTGKIPPDEVMNDIMEFVDFTLWKKKYPNSYLYERVRTESKGISIDEFPEEIEY